jgi:diguanylate cyclase (GGDEF)-like protein
MPNDRELPEGDSDGSTSGGKPEIPGRDRTADQTEGDGDQTGTDIEQTLSDADQTLSEADQTSSELDQAHSDADQVASDRDQAAAERMRAEASANDQKYMKTLVASGKERAQGTAEREATSEQRSTTMFDRADDAARRDEQATLRDIQGTARDRAADVRDRASNAHQRATGAGGAQVSSARATSAADRVRAAADRARAARDRQQAGRDREHARIELEKAHLDELTGFYRLGLGKVVVQREIDRSRRSGSQLVLAYCDVDGLKRVNDEQGHAAGDALLEGLAVAIRSRLRSYDPVVRVGGDEFICALTEVDLDQAAGIFHDIQVILAAGDHEASVSFGLAALEADDSLATLIARGDDALRVARAASP